MFQVITKNPLDELIRNPRNYLTIEEDEVLLQFTHRHTGETFYLMAGIDDDSQQLYLVLEDEDQTSDIYCKDDNFYNNFCELMIHILSFDKGVFK